MEFKSSQVKNTVYEMFNQRNYTNINEENNNLIATKPNGNKVCIFLDIKEKLNSQQIHDFISSLEKMSINHGIIICNESTPAVKTVVNNTPELNIYIEIFQTSDLQINITKHKLVSQHILLSKEESKSLKDQYGKKFPILLKSDPVSKFYNFQPGDIIKVIRSGGFVSYRIVK